MTPAAHEHLLITHAPEVPGITAAARRDDSPCRLTVTLAGGRVWWTITGTSPTASSGQGGLIEQWAEFAHTEGGERAMNDDLSWRKSGFSGSNGGESVAVAAHASTILIRGTKHQDNGPIHSYSTAQRHALLAAIRAKSALD